MSTHHRPPKTAPRPFMRRMSGRSPNEVHRASTPLELLFDLVFVVAVAFAGTRLHHGIVAGHAAHALVSYCMVFFSIWWAWLNFSFFASAYDVDDVVYRLMVFVQLTGAAVLAAGVPQAFDNADDTVATLGYVIMRASLILQWLRAARSDPTHAATAYRYAAGIFIVQMGWIAQLYVPFAGMATFAILIICEILVPIYAKSRGHIPFHVEHIAERFSLFTIIVLGELILSASTAIQTGMEAGHLGIPLIIIAVSGLLTVFTMWWLYFDAPAHHLLTSVKAAFVWGYGHVFVLSSAAAVGAGLATTVDFASNNPDIHISAMTAGAAVAVPVAVYLISLWFIHERKTATSTAEFMLFTTGAVAVLSTIFLTWTVFWVGIVMACLLATKLTLAHKPF